MNLILRLIYFLLTTGKESSMQVTDKVVTTHYVSPLDLDLNFHMNNGKYLSIMDIGRIVVMKKLGLLSVIFKNKWTAVAGGVSINYKRSLKVFQRYELHTQIIYWDEKWIYGTQETWREGKLMSSALVRGLITCPKTGKVPTSKLLKEIGREDLKSPPKPQLVRDMEESSDILLKKS